MYCEIVEHDYRKDRGRIIEVGQLRDTPADYERYCSLYYADKGILDYVNIHKSVAKYPGKRTARLIWIDIDNESPEVAHGMLMSVIEKLNTGYGLSPDDLFIYFSGNKGYHVGIHQNTIGELGWHTNMAEKSKEFVFSVVGKEHVDSKIYDNQRIFRLPQFS